MTGESLYLLNAGTARQEIVPENTPLATPNFPGFSDTYSGFSGSLGASYQLPDNCYIKANLSKGYRAPAITEVGENGVHPGTSNYEIGDPKLQPESSYEGDLAFGLNGRDVGFEVDGFYNYIQNFIFATRISSVNGGDSLTSGLPTFKFKANNAYIEGIEAFFKIHPQDTKWIEINNGFTYIYTFIPNQTDSTQHIPWTPAPRLTSEVKLKLNTGHNSILNNAFVKFGVAEYWAQTNVYSANWTEFPSKDYMLLNAGIGTNFVNPKTSRVICSFFVNVTNLANIGYADHTSRIQYFLSYNGVTPVTVVQPNQGIYNMGHNVQFKLIFPIGGGKIYHTEAASAGSSENKGY
jgi:iron complex outermembrane receptor protein